jgi:hypothetical protein
MSRLLKEKGREQFWPKKGNLPCTRKNLKNEIWHLKKWLAQTHNWKGKWLETNPQYSNHRSLTLNPLDYSHPSFCEIGYLEFTLLWLPIHFLSQEITISVAYEKLINSPDFIWLINKLAVMTRKWTPASKLFIKGKMNWYEVTKQSRTVHTQGQIYKSIQHISNTIWQLRDTSSTYFISKIGQLTPALQQGLFDLIWLDVRLCWSMQ